MTVLHLAIALAVSAPAAPAAAQAVVKPCTIDQVAGPAECGTFDVWENREAKSGRRIPLNIIVLRALATPVQPDPLVFLQGGPGDAPSFNARFYSRVFEGVRRTRDLVLIDLRGTGRSAPLTCPELSQPDASGVLDADQLGPAAVKTCRSRLEKNADLRFYTTAIAVDDLNDVLSALGYARVNVYGTSYGTRVAQVFLQRHPGRLRTVSMKGIVPASMAAPANHAAAGEAAWRALVSRCRADAGCAKAFPRVAEEFDALLARLEKAPPMLTLAASSTRAAVRLRVTRGLFAEAFRNVLYSPEAAAGAPKLVHQLQRGDDRSLVETALAARTLLAGDRLSAGFFLSVTCAEDIPFLPPDAVKMTNGTFGGDYRLRQQTAACAVWPRGAVPADHRQPVRSDVPALLLSGEYDPATPPSGGDEVARGLARGRHVILRNNGHPIGSSEACTGQLIATFIDRGSSNGLDASCAQALPPVPFQLPPTGDAHDDRR
jgi:pimeloyl-ACP methyl ester carboxylesterase